MPQWAEEMTREEAFRLAFKLAHELDVQMRVHMPNDWFVECGGEA